MNAITPNRLDRSRKRKLRLLNVIKRGRIFYFKKRAGATLFFESLRTDDETLAVERAKVKAQQLVDGELARLRKEKKAASLADIFATHQPPAGPDGRRPKMPRSLYCQCQALLGVVNMAKAESGKRKAEEICTTELTPKLVRDYQDAMRRRYELELTDKLAAQQRRPTADELADARDKADRSSKSLFKQAKNLFCKKHARVERYREQGLIIPECVKDFCATKAIGSMRSKVYLPADDAALERTFTEIEQEPHDGPVYRLFWAVIAIGGRRGEVLDMRVEDFADLDGQLWIRGGRGKDKREIQLPVINCPVHASSSTKPVDVVRRLIAEAKAAGRSFLFNGSEHFRHDVLSRLVNAWLAARGWRDEKKLHALRAYVGSLLYAKDPHLAKDYLRHKSLLTTEQFYTHFFKLKVIPNMQLVAQPATNVVPMLKAEG